MGQVLTRLCGCPTRTRDAIYINELLLRLSVSSDDADASKARPQAVLLSLVITHDVLKTAHSDDLPTHSIIYAAVRKTLVEHLPSTRYASLETLLDHVFDTVFNVHPEVSEASVVAALRDTIPRFTVKATRRRAQTPSTGPYRFTIGGLALASVKPVMFDIVVRRRQRIRVQECFPFFGLTTSVRRTFAALEYSTKEALASAVVRHVLEYTKDKHGEVTVLLSEPNALPLATSARVRARVAPLPGVPPPVREKTASAKHSVALALGSNLDDRFANIETALRLLEIPTRLLSDLPRDAVVSVVNTSFMYETAPMYVTDQPRFANCACMIETNLSSEDLLRLVKAIETAVGRVPGKRHGSRIVDLDILTYDDRLEDTRPPDSRATLDNLIGELVVPHPRICEREFVLRPLNDMIPDFVHPMRHKTIRTLLDEVISTRSKDDEPMFKVMPFPKYPLDEGAKLADIHGVQVPPTAKHWIVSPAYPSQRGRPLKTHLMAILNVTPDSFSDGAKHNTIPNAISYTADAVKSGADIIDIGGCSTRPGSEPVFTEEESWRVVPVIEAIRKDPNEHVRRALVSVDTFRWEVAEEAVRAGANCINDVYAFMGPTYPPDDASLQHFDKMRGVARRYGVPVVLMHSRGEAGMNKKYDACPRGLVSAVQTELGERVNAIVRGPGGVRRWLVMVDPGIGFSKPEKEQLALMRDLSRVTALRDDHDPENTGNNALAGFPLLFGASKKSVLGAVLEKGGVGGMYPKRKTTAEKRGWATAAAVACGVQQGASVVRVHDVAEMRDVVTIASAIWCQ